MNKSWMRSVLLFFCVLLMTNAHALTCTTVASGNFTDANVWDCGCDATNCDTLVITHEVFIDQSLSVVSAQVHVSASGELTATAPVHFLNNLWNTGDLSATLIHLSNPSAVFQNSGQVFCNELILECDSALNSGTMSIVDDLLIRNTFLNNQGLLSTGTTGTTTFATLYNSGEMHADSVLYMTTLYVLPEGTLNAGHVLSTSLVLNEGEMNVNNATLLNLVQHGALQCSGVLQLGSSGFIGSVTTYTNSSIQTGSLINYDNVTMQTNALTLTGDLVNWGQLNGHGTICILDSSVNHGTVLGSLRICDNSPTIGADGFDINTGNVESSINFCDDPICNTIGIPERIGGQAMAITPMPVTGVCTIELDSVGDQVTLIQIMDGVGRVVSTLRGPFGDSITWMPGDDLTGAYHMLAVGPQGAVLARAKVIICTQ